MSPGEINTSSVKRPGAFFGHITQTIRDLASSRFHPLPNTNALDVGCGNGLFFASLGSPNAKLIGVDLDRSLLVEAKEIFSDNRIRNIDLVAGDVTHLPFKDNSVDNIFFLNTLVNIPSDFIAFQLLNELMRICRSDGRIFVDIRNKSNLLLRIRYWLHNRSADFSTRSFHLRQISGIFASNGYHLVAKHNVGSPILFATWAFLLEYQNANHD